MEHEIQIREMDISDYENVRALWMTIRGFGIRSIDDSRRGCFYHVCVHEQYRKQGIGTSMAVFAMKALQKEQINKVSLIAFKENEVGNHFWKRAGWTFREDLNYYDFTLNDANITQFNQ